MSKNHRHMVRIRDYLRIRFDIIEYVREHYRSYPHSKDRTRKPAVR